MKKITTNLLTLAEFSDDEKKRYLLTKTWDSQKPRLTIVMMAPSIASGVELDDTTMRVLGNASRLGYGSVSIVNLFATIGDFSLSCAEREDKINNKYIDSMAKESDIIVFAAGVGKASNKTFLRRQNQVLDVLKPYENKLFCLSNEEGKARFQHPLSPSVRIWYLSKMMISELYRNDITDVVDSKATAKTKQQKK